jgi:hypothetical protein
VRIGGYAWALTYALTQEKVPTTKEMIVAFETFCAMNRIPVVQDEATNVRIANWVQGTFDAITTELGRFAQHALFERLEEDVNAYQTDFGDSSMCVMCGKEGATMRRDGKMYHTHCWQVWNS